MSARHSDDDAPRAGSARGGRRGDFPKNRECQVESKNEVMDFDQTRDLFPVNRWRSKDDRQ